MSTSGQIEMHCRPWMQACFGGDGAVRTPQRPRQFSAVVQEVGRREREQPRKACKHGGPKQTAAAVLPRPSRAEPAPWAVVDDLTEARYAAKGWDDEHEEWDDEHEEWDFSEEFADEAIAKRGKVEEYLFEMFPHAEPALVTDVAGTAVEQACGTFAAIAWAQAHLTELLRPPAASVAPPVVEAEEDWGFVEIATPRSVVSEASWADCGPAPPAPSYAAVASTPGVWPRAAPQSPQTRSGYARRAAAVRECPSIPEDEAAKEDRVWCGEQRRFALLKEKRASAPRARRLERRLERQGCVAVC